MTDKLQEIKEALEYLITIEKAHEPPCYGEQTNEAQQALTALNSYIEERNSEESLSNEIICGSELYERALPTPPEGE